MDELMKIALNRFSDAGISVSQEKYNRIFWSILGELECNGYEAAYIYVTTASLLK